MELFWPLLAQNLPVVKNFPLTLRVELEQELARDLWQPLLAELQMPGTIPEQWPRRLLDLYHLTALAGLSLSELPARLTQGLGEDVPTDAILTALTRWRDYCWREGLLTYGIVAELYGQHLWPHGYYQRKLRERFAYLLADDVDEYPALLATVAAGLLGNDVPALFTFNPHGAARLGLGADPAAWQELRCRCHVHTLTVAPGLAPIVPAVLATLASAYGTEAVPQTYGLEAPSRGKLLRQTAQAIATGLAAGSFAPGEVAIIAPGLDSLAAYAIAEILGHQGWEVIPLDEQRPLWLVPPVRALIALMALVYPGLGRTLSRDRVAEMLAVLVPTIDPVRAGLLADCAYRPDPDRPELLPSESLAEWYRLGYAASTAYEDLRTWVQAQKAGDVPLLFFDRAIRQWLLPRYGDFASRRLLQELLETTQHYWQMGSRLHWPAPEIRQRFVHTLMQGAVAANPFVPEVPATAIVVATIYQYRTARLHHRYQFWLDSGSPLWTQGGRVALFGAPLLLRSWDGTPLSPTQTAAADRDRLERLLADLLERAGDGICLCASETDARGQPQDGPLSPLALTAAPWPPYNVEEN
ncbi:MAG: hypothetical protein HC918_03550 [Oscillatoriales cyanobacterium SM2_1_8]|nr:hypothetical protein [Oscillatoriales cyanobacterium SM2_1_8]